MIEVSCIVVNYNNGKYLRTCLDSLVNQSKKIDEIIVADDCSTDNSRKILNEYKLKYDNFTLILNEKNLGVTKNRDFAIRNAKGVFITTLDSDDFFYPTKIEKEFNLINEFPDSIVTSDTIDIDEKGRYLFTRLVESFCLYTDIERVNQMICKSKNVIPRDMMMSKETYFNVGGFDLDFQVYEDWEFKLRLCIMKKNWKYSGSKGTAYRHTKKGLSSKKRLRLTYFHLKAIFKNYKFVSYKTVYFISLLKFIFIKIPTVYFHISTNFFVSRKLKYINLKLSK